MDASEIYRRLSLINDKLKNKNLRGDLTIYGGAVMCLCFHSRISTHDIDGWFAPKSEINLIIDEITRENNFENGWINDAVKGFISRKDDVEVMEQFSNLTIYKPKDRYLFAMKCMSCRLEEGQNDIDDIKFLIDRLRITSSEEAESIILEYFPSNLILTKTHFMLLELLGK